MILFYNKKNKRFIGTLDAPANAAGIKIIPGGVDPRDIAETKIDPKLLKGIAKLRKISPSHIKVILNKNNKVVGFEQEKSKISYNELRDKKEIRQQQIKGNLKRLQNKRLPTKRRLDALSELIELKALIQ